MVMNMGLCEEEGEMLHMSWGLVEVALKSSDVCG